jgi:hypothetical protein
VPDVEFKAVQRAKAKRATLAGLLAKKPNREEFSISLGAGGEQISFLYVSIGAVEYDALLTEHPPDPDQRVAGASFNVNTFAPALLARVCREPAIDVTGWTEIWTSPKWGRGEVMGLFWKATNLCSKEIDPTPINAD